MKTIVGAGLAGLIAAHAWPRADLLEAAAAPAQMHNAVLRFRNDSVARLTGIEFRRVTVRKGLWSYGHFVAPDVRLANRYSRKCLGRLVGERSIWRLDPVERFIAPENFYDQLLDAVGNRITWGHAADFRVFNQNTPVVSTAPLPVVVGSLGIETALEFDRSPITVRRYRVADCDVHQTVYFTDPDCALYRASITTDILITEHVGFVRSADYELGIVCAAFGLDTEDLQELGTTKQSYGKIAPVEDSSRKALLFRLTHEHGIYSLGRFATWKNILLDDVVDDVVAIKKLMRSGTYELRQHAR